MVVFAGISQDDDGKLKPLRLVDREEWDAALGEWILGVFELGLAASEESVEIGAEEEPLEEVPFEKVGGDDSDVLVVEAREVLGDEGEVGDGAFVLVSLGDVEHILEVGEAAQ